MDITEVKVKLMPPRKDKLRAFCSITFDNAFVVHDVKVIEGAKGTFVAMPSRRLTQHCVRCAVKNPMRSTFCNGCGNKLPSVEDVKDQNGRVKLHADIVHPINSDCREMIQHKVLTAYNDELKRAVQPDYNPTKNIPIVEKEGNQ